MLFFLYAFLIAGFSSFLAGIFGGGIGLVAVPLLSKLFILNDIPQKDNMRIVIGTIFAFSLGVMLIATIKQHKKKNVNWSLFLHMVLPIAFGVIIGSFSASILNMKIVKIFFVTVLLIFTCYGAISSKRKNENILGPKIKFSKSDFLITWIIGICIGITSLGILIVPYIRTRRIPLISAIATTQALTVINSLVGTLSYIALGINNKLLPNSCIGFVDWQMLVPLMLGGIFFTKLGIKVSNFIPNKTLNILFNLFLLSICVTMLIF